jgi:hypothetical protein
MRALCVQSTDFRLQITDYRLQITYYRQITDHRSQIIDHGSQSTKHRAHISGYTAQSKSNKGHAPTALSLAAYVSSTSSCSRCTATWESCTERSSARIVSAESTKKACVCVFSAFLYVHKCVQRPPLRLSMVTKTCTCSSHTRGILLYILLKLFQLSLELFHFSSSGQALTFGLLALHRCTLGWVSVTVSLRIRTLGEMVALYTPINSALWCIVACVSRNIWAVFWEWYLNLVYGELFKFCLKKLVLPAHVEEHVFVFLDLFRATALQKVKMKHTSDSMDWSCCWCGSSSSSWILRRRIPKSLGGASSAWRSSNSRALLSSWLCHVRQSSSCFRWIFIYRSVWWNPHTGLLHSLEDTFASASARHCFLTLAYFSRSSTCSCFNWKN